MTDERAVRMAQETGALAAAIRREVEEHPERHPYLCSCVLCRALAMHDRRQP
jgi:hypothetical protein